MAKPLFKAFLSHRYKSPEVNKYFFELLAAHGDLQFEVDVATKATNVTRLERLVRDSDAFVGIYPYPSEDDTRPSHETALRASRYFRLELDLAARSQRPAIVFIDKRYGTAITVPRRIRECRYDHREVLDVTSQRHRQNYSDAAHSFCEEVAAFTRLSQAERWLAPERDRVGILLPNRRYVPSGYSRTHIEHLEERLLGMSLTSVHMDWQGPMNGKFLSELESLDWAIVDIGKDSCSGGLPAFLHGQFVPQMRMLRCMPGDEEARSPLERILLREFDVGYPKDIVRWRDARSLYGEFVQRLTTLYEPRKYIGNAEKARQYFASAALRNETVFLSYSGEDRDLAADLARALRGRFQQVFDYRDTGGQSIVPGRRWIEEIFDKLSTSAVGIPLLSPSYFKSGNCKHEAREMMGLADSGKLRIIPVKISEGPLDLPSWMRDIQYFRGWEYKSSEELVARLISAYDAS